MPEWHLIKRVSGLLNILVKHCVTIRYDNGLCYSLGAKFITHDLDNLRMIVRISDDFIAYIQIKIHDLTSLTVTLR